MSLAASPAADVGERVEEFAGRVRTIRDSLHKVVIGQNGVIDQLLMCALTGLHALLVGVAAYAVRLCGSSRPEDGRATRYVHVRDYVARGAGPRASQNLVVAFEARALLTGRTAPTVEDVRAIAAPILRHRIPDSAAWGAPTSNWRPVWAMNGSATCSG